MKRIEDVRGAVIAEVRGRSCGECSMCCNLLEIKTPELRKPANQGCRHCLPRNGCAIYERRPPVCRTFACLWLIDSRIGEHGEAIRIPQPPPPLPSSRHPKSWQFPSPLGMQKV
jgi:hypothetical protein